MARRRSAEVDPAGISPLFQEEMSEVQAISPTVRRTVPAELTPSVLLGAAEAAGVLGWEPMFVPTPVQTMAPTPVRLPIYQHPTDQEGGEGVGIGAGRHQPEAVGPKGGRGDDVHARVALPLQ